MRKILFMMIAAMTMSFMACGGSTAKDAEGVDTDSVTVDSVADSIVVDSVVANV